MVGGLLYFVRVGGVGGAIHYNMLGGGGHEGVYV